MGVLALRLQSISDSEMAGLKVFLALCCAVAAVNGVQLERKPFKRLIPADVLRDFRDSCFASTKCKVFGNQETWSLAPFLANQNASNSSLAGWLRRSLTVDLLS